MKKSSCALLLVAAALSGCGEEAPPKPAVKAQPPQAPQPAAPKTETKALPPAPVAVAPKPDPNKELAARVKQALEGEAKIQAAGIDVTAADGKVTLWGTAATESERSRAAQAAAKVAGVKAVDNRIAVVKGS